MPSQKTIIINDKPFVMKLSEIKEALRIELVSRTEQEKLWNQLVKSYHYLGYNKTIAIKYLVWFESSSALSVINCL